MFIYLLPMLHYFVICYVGVKYEYNIIIKSIVCLILINDNINTNIILYYTNYSLIGIVHFINYRTTYYIICIIYINYHILYSYIST